MTEHRATDWFQVEVAAGVLLSGGVILHATEGVWGIACDPFQEAAVRRVSSLKQRGSKKGFVLIGAPGEFDREIRALSAATRTAVEASWPGPVTWVVPNSRFPEWAAAADGTVAVRVPGHDQACRLAALCGGALVSTSANPAGRIPARSALAARNYFGARVDFVLPGATNAAPGGASEIRVACTGRVARARVNR